MKGEKLVATLGYQWDVKEDSISSTMEPAVVSKKRGMSQNMKLSDIRNNAKLVTKRGLAVFCASVVSTDSVLSVPLQLGAKLLLSRASVLSPGLESENKPLVNIDSEFTQDVLSQIKSIRKFKSILPLITGQVRNLYDRIYGEYIDHQRMITKDQWKYIVYPHAKRERLYNLEKDPYEKNDLSNHPEYLTLKSELKQDLKQLQKEMNDDLDIDNPPDFWDPTIKKNKKRAGAH